MSCERNYCDWIACGQDSILVQSALLPSTTYTWYLTTPQNAKYSGTVETDTAGHFVLTGLPNGMLNPYAGAFVLSVGSPWNDSAYCDPHDTITFEVRNGNSDKNTIGEDCFGVEATCCQPTLIEFTDEATHEVTYTAEMRTKYGDLPTVQVWVYVDGVLTNVGVSVSFDANPATLITVDFGGISSGVIVIK